MILEQPAHGIIEQLIMVLKFLLIYLYLVVSLSTLVKLRIKKKVNKTFNLNLFLVNNKNLLKYNIFNKDQRERLIKNTKRIKELLFKKAYNNNVLLSTFFRKTLSFHYNEKFFNYLNYWYQKIHRNNISKNNFNINNLLIYWYDIKNFLDNFNILKSHILNFFKEYIIDKDKQLKSIHFQLFLYWNHNIKINFNELINNFNKLLLIKSKYFFYKMQFSQYKNIMFKYVDIFKSRCNLFFNKNITYNNYFSFSFNLQYTNKFKYKQHFLHSINLIYLLNNIIYKFFYFLNIYWINLYYNNININFCNINIISSYLILLNLYNSVLDRKYWNWNNKKFYYLKYVPCNKFFLYINNNFKISFLYNA